MKTGMFAILVGIVMCASGAAQVSAFQPGRERFYALLELPGSESPA